MAEPRSESAEQLIGARVVRDEEFRAALLKDPAATLAREFGAKIPDGVRIVVHEESDDEIHLVVPGRLKVFDGLPDDVMDDTILDIMRTNRTGCCTCGSSTEQSLSSMQAGCGC